MPDEKLDHLRVRGRLQTTPYTSPLQGGGRVRRPPRIRAEHGRSLLAELERVRQAEGVGAAGAPDRDGIHLHFESDPGFQLKLESLEARGQGIEVVAVRTEADGMIATVFLPIDKVGYFTRKLEEYVHEDTRHGRPKNAAFVESVAAIRRATLRRAFWTDDPALFPAPGARTVWEVWLRAAEGSEARFRSSAATAGIELSALSLAFPERIVVLARARPEQFTDSPRVLDHLAELRRGQPPLASPVLLEPREQADVVDAVLRRLTPAGPDAPAACLLDTGVNAGHRLLQDSLDEADLFAYSPEWGTADHDGHGTQMAGIALLGDIAVVAADDAPLVLRHRLESAKILPPEGANPLELYGAITMDAVALVELARPSRRRAFVLTISTSEERRAGRPSSWSGEIDQLASGAFDGERRLVGPGGPLRSPSGLPPSPARAGTNLERELPLRSPSPRRDAQNSVASRDRLHLGGSTAASAA